MVLFLPEDTFLNVIRLPTLLDKFSEESRRCVPKFDCIVEPILHLNVTTVLPTLLEVQWMQLYLHENVDEHVLYQLMSSCAAVNIFF